MEPVFTSQQEASRKIHHLINVHVESKCKIRPHCIITGPSGSGKSFLTNSIYKQLDVPFFELNAAQITQEGLSGNSLTKAMRPLRDHWNQPNVIFVDEFDKLLQQNGEKTENFRSGVQDEFLQLLESKYASVFTDYGKYEPVLCENSLFIFAGAFSGAEITQTEDLRALGLRTEFVGRVPLVISTKQVTIEELRKALPKLKLFNDYLSLYPSVNKGSACKAIIKLIEEQHKNNLGIRLLNSVTHQYFMKDM